MEGGLVAKGKWGNGKGNKWSNGGSKGKGKWGNGKGNKWSNSRNTWGNGRYYGGWRNGGGAWGNGGGRMFGPFPQVPGKSISQVNFRIGANNDPAATGFSYRISVQGCH